MSKQEHPYAQVLRWVADGESIEWRVMGSEGFMPITSPEDLLRSIALPKIGLVPANHFRLKPRTIRIGEFDVPEPMRVAPENGACYWMPLHSRANMDECDAKSDTWSGHPVDRKRLARGLCHATREAAEAHARALLSFTTTEAE